MQLVLTYSTYNADLSSLTNLENNMNVYETIQKVTN